MMAWYLFQGSLTPEAWVDLVQNPQDRRDALEPLMNAIGGSIEHYFFALGGHDIYILYQAPDNQAVAATMMAERHRELISSIKRRTTKPSPQR